RRAWSALSTSRPTTAPAPPPCASPAARPEGRYVHVTEGASSGAPFVGSAGSIIPLPRGEIQGANSCRSRILCQNKRYIRCLQRRADTARTLRQGKFDDILMG